MKFQFEQFIHLKLFDGVIKIVFGIMLLLLVLGIVIGTAHLFLRLGDLLTWEDSTRHYVRIISDVLTLFILIELARTFADYFIVHRLRMTFIADAGIVFILRELVVKLFEARIDTAEIYALSGLIAVLGALRIGSVLVFTYEKRMLEQLARAVERGDSRLLGSLGSTHA
jgi:uncharacterized membrane protein (DUF373 family)